MVETEHYMEASLQRLINVSENDDVSAISTTRNGNFSTGSALWRRVMVPGGLFVLVLLLYVPSARLGFVYDDFDLIVEVPAPRTLGEIASVFTKRHWHDLPYYRPIAGLSIQLQHYLHGLRPAPFHLFNATLMAAAAVAAYALWRQPAFGVPPVPAALAAALLAAHPIVSSCVYPISSGRETLLPAVFIVAAVTAALHRGLGWRVAALALWVLALLSKEQAVIVPGLFLLADALGLSADPPRDWRKWLLRYLPVMAILVAYFAVRSSVFPGGAAHRVAVLHYPLRPLWSLAFFFQSTLTPFIDLVYEPRRAIWFDPWRVPVCLGILVVLFVITCQRWREVQSAMLFWLGWIVLALLPTANLLAQENLYAERYGLLALVGAAGAAATLATSLWHVTSVRRAVTCLAVVVTIAAAAVSVHRAAFFLDELTFLSQWRHTDPNSYQAKYNLAAHHMRQEEFDQTELVYREMLTRWSRDPKVLGDLGLALLRQSKLDEAAEALTRTLRIDARDSHAHNRLGMVFQLQGHLHKAARQYARALEVDPGHTAAQENLARIQSRLNESP